MRRAKRRDPIRELTSRLNRHIEASLDATKTRRIRTRSARYAACLAEKLGIIERPKCCEWCRRRAKLERHHWEYLKPLMVSFFCPDCHQIADAMNLDSEAA